MGRSTKDASLSSLRGFLLVSLVPSSMVSFYNLLELLRPVSQDVPLQRHAFLTQPMASNGEFLPSLTPLLLRLGLWWSDWWTHCSWDPTKNLQGMIQRTTIRWENAEELCVPENSIVHFFPSNFKIPTKYLLPRLDDDPMMKRVRTVQQNRVWAFYMIKALVPRFQVIFFWLYSDFSWIFECLGWYEKRSMI